MYSVGDTIKYMTAHIKTQKKEKQPQVKVGIIEEAFSTLDNKPCYWIAGEKELILGSQVVEKVQPLVLDYTTPWGGTERVLPKLAMYTENNNLYVGLDFFDTDCDTWLPYADVTVNVGALPYLESAIDTNNNGQGIIAFLVENGFGELTGDAIPSGFCVFPVFRFNEEKLKEIDSFEFKNYAKAHGRDVSSQTLDEKISEAEEIVELIDKAVSGVIEKPNKDIGR